MNKTDLEILKNMLPAKMGTPPDFAVALLEDTCRKTGIDWKLRHAYLMNRGGKWMVTLSIDGFRLIGSQDPDYGGQEGPFWVIGPAGTWSDIPPDGPIYAAKVGIKHKSGITTYGVAKFKDYRASDMWDKFPSTMSAKCAEMLAWRKAFPGLLGGLYGAEEMAQADKGGVEKSAPKAAQATRADYEAALRAAPDVAQLKAVGAAIQADLGLDSEDLLALSIVWESLKKNANL